MRRSDISPSNCWTNASLTEKNVTSRLIQNILIDGMSHWNTEHWTKVKENYSKKLFCKYISFFFFIFLRFKQIERLKGWNCFIIPRTCNKVNHSFQSIAVFLSSPGSHVELLLLQMLYFSLPYYNHLLWAFLQWYSRVQESLQVS